MDLEIAKSKGDGGQDRKVERLNVDVGSFWTGGGSHDDSKGAKGSIADEIQPEIESETGAREL